ncbi:hypothetical protein VTK56DRAFT_2087 [Thermocarpiscus australiensis]
MIGNFHLCIHRYAASGTASIPIVGMGCRQHQSDVWTVKRKLSQEIVSPWPLQNLCSRMRRSSPTNWVGMRVRDHAARKALSGASLVVPVISQHLHDFKKSTLQQRYHVNSKCQVQLSEAGNLQVEPLRADARCTAIGHRRVSHFSFFTIRAFS